MMAVLRASMAWRLELPAGTGAAEFFAIFSRGVAVAGRVELDDGLGQRSHHHHDAAARGMRRS